MAFIASSNDIAMGYKGCECTLWLPHVSPKLTTSEVYDKSTFRS